MTRHAGSGQLRHRTARRCHLIYFPPEPSTAHCRCCNTTGWRKVRRPDSSNPRLQFQSRQFQPSVGQVGGSGLKAIILCAGQGRRLLPLTERVPKCLLPVAGRSILEWQLPGLAAAGIKDITLVTGFEAEAVEQLVHSITPAGVVIRTVFKRARMAHTRAKLPDGSPAPARVVCASPGH